jgi:hypothetical protein
MTDVMLSLVLRNIALDLPLLGLGFII